MSNVPSKASAKKAKFSLTIPKGEREIEDFLTKLYDARKYSEDLEKANHSGRPTEIAARAQALPEAREQCEALEKQYRELRGDFHIDSPKKTQGEPLVSLMDWRMRIQEEAFEHWIRLRAAGCSPTVHSILDWMATWAHDNDVKTKTGVYPSAGHLRNTVLCAGHWEPPTHSVEKAKEHVAQRAQVAQLYASSLA